jgi:hypothetical protein
MVQVLSVRLPGRLRAPSVRVTKSARRRLMQLHTGGRCLRVEGKRVDVGHGGEVTVKHCLREFATPWL